MNHKPEDQDDKPLAHVVGIEEVNGELVITVRAVDAEAFRTIRRFRVNFEGPLGWSAVGSAVPETPDAS
jgi:hypothetical protein